MDDFAAIFGDWLQNGVDVEPHAGAGAFGDQWGASQSKPDVMVEEKRRMVITSEGTEATSEATLYVDRADAAPFNDKARVTLPSGRVAYVLHVSDFNVFGLPGHVVVNVS